MLGQLRPGEHLAEAELAAKMRVSRGPVREALRQLELESLVQARPNGRTLVSGLSRAGIEQLYDARLCLEGHALRLAARRIEADELDRLQATLDEMLAAWRDGRPVEVNERDVRFHRQLVAAGGNRPLLRLWQTLSPQIQALLAITNVVNPRAESIAAKHQQLLDALRVHDGERAVERLASHLAEAMCVLLERMEQTKLLDAPSDSQPATT